MKVILISLISFQLLTICFSLRSVDLDSYYKEYIEDFGYKLEEFKVETKDGYILTLWHLVNTLPVDPKKVVYFQPGFLCTGWVYFKLAEKSLPFLLLPKGYDVWIGNSRGTIFSLGHKTKDSSDYNGEYWDFSMDETVYYDLPASIDFVKKKTKAQKVHYIGHSQATTLFAMLYMHSPDYIESSITSFSSLGTVPSITHTHLLPINIVDTIYKLIELVRPVTKAVLLGNTERNLLASVCKKLPAFCKLTFEKAASIHGTNRIDYKNMYPYLYYYPGGTSFNTLLHWSQIHQEKKLVYYNPDYDTSKETTKPYNTEIIKKWNIKSFIQRSDEDSFSSFTDVTEFVDMIENKSIIKLVDTPNYGHADDLAAESAVQDLFIPIVDFIEKSK